MARTALTIAEIDRRAAEAKQAIIDREAAKAAKEAAKSEMVDDPNDRTIRVMFPITDHKMQLCLVGFFQKNPQYKWNVSYLAASLVAREMFAEPADSVAFMNALPKFRDMTPDKQNGKVKVSQTKVEPPTPTSVLDMVKSMSQTDIEALRKLLNAAIGPQTATT